MDSRFVPFTVPQCEAIVFVNRTFGEGLFDALRGQQRVLSAFSFAGCSAMTKSWEKCGWIEAYRSAMLGTPVDKSQIEAAKTAITERIAAILKVTGSDEEMHALKQAYEDLLLLEREATA